MGLVYFYHVLIMLDKELCVWGHGHPFSLILFLNFWGSCIYGQERALFRGWLVFFLCLLHLFWMYYSIFYPYSFVIESGFVSGSGVYHVPKRYVSLVSINLGIQKIIFVVVLNHNL